MFYHCDHVPLSLPAGHRFPSDKYRRLRDRLLSDGVVSAHRLREAPRASRAEVLRAHAADYVDRVRDGALSREEVRRIGVPWTPQLYARAMTTVGGALAAAREALRSGVSGQLTGGTHHAHHDFGAGYCVFNDFAVAALTAVSDWGLSRVAIIDLDVHQGDGTASILTGRPAFFVFSMHGERNFPFRKAVSDLDVGLPDNTGDEAYLGRLDEHLPDVFAFKPELVLYQAGVDALEEDRLGRLALSAQGLRERDRLVLSACRSNGVPVSFAIGGGYADPIDATIDANANTFRAAKDVFGF